MALNVFLLFCLVIGALWTVMSRSLLRSAMWLALTSAVLSIILFRLNSPLAAVFELSVCTGLISVVFISTITLTHPLTRTEVLDHMKGRMRRFWYLPFILVIIAGVMIFMKINMDIKLPLQEAQPDVRTALWGVRQIDVIGQIIIILAGVLGIVILFKETKKND